LAPQVGLSLANSSVIFEKAEGSSLQLSGKSKGKVVRQSIINPDWDFSKMGIGGLDQEFNAIFRRAFASRVFPPEVMEQLGCKHVKGEAVVAGKKKFSAKFHVLERQQLLAKKSLQQLFAKNLCNNCLQKIFVTIVCKKSL
jgi:hypothetical protein